MEIAVPQKDAVIFGFDSAWTDKNPGAICAISFDRQYHCKFYKPQPVNFDEAHMFIEETRRDHAFSLVAIDQPTIVPNAKGMRPVERAAATFMGGGVQPANRSRTNMFGDGAPIWGFLSESKAVQDPFQARTANSGHFLIEVFPALALRACFSQRKGAPKYDPEKKNFCNKDWQSVSCVVQKKAEAFGIHDLAEWAKCAKCMSDRSPNKRDQDLLDSSICALIGLIWRAAHPEASSMIGDTEKGYMVTPVSDRVRQRLESAAAKFGVSMRSTQSKS